MTATNRKQAPVSSVPDHLRDIIVNHHVLRQGTHVYHLESTEAEIIRIDIVFQAGSRFQPANFIAGCTNSLLVEGTQKRSGSEIAEVTDYYGSYIYPFYDRDEAGITGFFLQKYARENFELIAELLMEPVFPQEEIDIFKVKKHQQLILDQQKPESIARRDFIESLFGADHPYGIHGNIQDLDLLNRDQLVDFHQRYYTPQTAHMILTCHDFEKNCAVLDEIFNRKPAEIPVYEKSELATPPVTAGFRYLPVRQATQVAIRLGQLMPGPHHPDYIKISMVNTLLGGYFGSRLMQNIREEKGLTYSIGSAIVSYKEASFLTISSSVSRDLYQLAIDETINEINKIREELMPEEELHILKNYLTGEFQRQLDGALTTADTLKTLLSSGLEPDYLSRFLSELREITPEIIRETAQHYFDPDTMIIRAAGPPEIRE